MPGIGSPIPPSPCALRRLAGSGWTRSAPCASSTAAGNCRARPNSFAAPAAAPPRRCSARSANCGPPASRPSRSVHGIVTLTHRRMKRDYDARKTSSGRQKRKRARASADASRVCGEDVTDVSRPCHADVTELSRQKAAPCHADVTPDERLGQRNTKERNFNENSDMAFDPQIEAPGVAAVSRDCHADVTPPSRLGKEEREAPPFFPPLPFPLKPLFLPPLLSPQEKEEISFGSRGGPRLPEGG